MGNPSCVQFDQQLIKYSKIAQEAESTPHEKDIEFVRISVTSLLKDIEEHANDWVVAIAKLLNNSVKQHLIDLDELMGEFSVNMDRSTDTLEDLKFILNVITEIHDRSMDIELQYTDIEERYRTLRMYKHPISEDEAE